MKSNSGYILLESLISLAILMIIVSSYIGVTTQMQRESQRRLTELANYRDLYNETRRCRLHSVSSTKSQITISLDQGMASNQQGSILIEKK